MKKLKLKRVFAALVTFAVLLSVMGAPSSAEEAAVHTGDGYKLMATDGGLKLYLNGETTNFYVEDSATGKRAYAFPEDVSNDSIAAATQKIEMQAALVFTLWDPVKKTENRKNSNAAAVKQGNYTVTETEGGFVINYNLKSQSIETSLSVTLKDGKLDCTVLEGSVKENDPENNKILRIAVLPFMISGAANTEGEIILPDGCGEILEFSTSKSTAAVYSKQIYGRDLSTTLSLESETGYDVNCPYLALNANGSGILAVPTNAAAVGYVNANPAGKSCDYANAYFSFDYRATDMAVIGDKAAKASQSTRVLSEDAYTGDMTVTYQFIFENSSKSALAKLYGEYILPQNETAEKTQRSAIFDVYGFVNEQKSFLGFPYTKSSVLSDGEDILALAEDKDLSGITINLKNITKDQQKQRINDDLKPISKVLSSSQLKTLTKSDTEVFVNANPLSFKKGTLTVNSFFGASQTIYGAPIGVYEYKESTHMKNKDLGKSLLIKYTKIDSIVKKLVSSAEKSGLDGFSSDELGSVSYHDYSSGGTLADTHLAQQKAIAAAAEKTDLILTNPNDYAIKYCTALLDVPVSSSNNDMCSGSYPFLQIALGDKIAYTTESVNLYRSSETMFLNAIATGSALHYSLVLTDTEPIISTELNYLYSADYSALEETVKRQYKSLCEVRNATQNSALCEYTKENNVVTSRFENGAVVTVDFENKTYSVAD